jgi:arsenate reductase (thioredoxin)
MKTRVLFVCIHNSARSQMAEAFLNDAGRGEFEAESAGITPGKLNPNVVQVMKEIGIDISHNKTKDVFDFVKQGKRFHYVITVCDEASAERCPIFPGATQRLHWSFQDPSSIAGTQAEVLTGTRQVRDEIRKRIVSWLESVRAPHGVQH